MIDTSVSSCIVDKLSRGDKMQCQRQQKVVDGRAELRRAVRKSLQADSERFTSSPTSALLVLEPPFFLSCRTLSGLIAIVANRKSRRLLRGYIVRFGLRISARITAGP